jgi:hypothetical protein
VVFHLQAIFLALEQTYLIQVGEALVARYQVKAVLLSGVVVLAVVQVMAQHFVMAVVPFMVVLAAVEAVAETAPEQ